MLKSRLIFTLLLQHGTYMLSRNFNLQAVGDLQWIKQYYNFDAIAFSIDELIVLNVEREDSDMQQFSRNLLELNKNCFMPIAAGGNIRTLDDAFLLLHSGADKVVVNTPLFSHPSLVTSLVDTFGSQCVIASIDYKGREDNTEVFIEHGMTSTGCSVEECVQRAHDLGCGEIYLTSMDLDGTGYGYDLTTITKVNAISKVPVIASGGAGKYEHFAYGIIDGNVSAASTANLFNFLADGLTEARKSMDARGIPVARWDYGYHSTTSLLDF
jgi:cyclase